LADVRVVLHPEVTIRVVANVARSPEEAERQARGERVGHDDDEDDNDQPVLGGFDDAEQDQDETA
ncbi:MAG: hypothetical protein ACRYGI_16275, partial [Janthinobacterium lividum]